MSPDVVSQTNAKIAGMFTGVKILNVIGWFVAAIICIAVGIYSYIWWRDRKVYSKKITAFEIIGGYWQPSLRDTAKVIKIGTGGFEILYLKKLKVWKIAYGGRVGKDTYYFFIMPDGYWINGMLSANMSYIDKNNGLIPVVTTNPLMRSQYTSLEKQIDTLHSEKKSFMDKYGSWVLGISFVLVAGVMLWLNYKEFATASGALSDGIKKLVESKSICSSPPVNSGLIPVG